MAPVRNVAGTRSGPLPFGTFRNGSGTAHSTTRHLSRNFVSEEEETPRVEVKGALLGAWCMVVGLPPRVRNLRAAAGSHPPNPPVATSLIQPRGRPPRHGACRRQPLRADEARPRCARRALPFGTFRNAVPGSIVRNVRLFTAAQGPGGPTSEPGRAHVGQGVGPKRAH